MSSESDIGGIKDGDQATFTVDAYPNRTFQGAVAQVRQSPQTVQNVVTYDVVVSVDNTDLALKPGMTATVQIVTDRARRCAARARPGAALCAGRFAASAGATGIARVWVLRDGKPVAVPVVPGSTTTPTPRSSGAT